MRDGVRVSTLPAGQTRRGWGHSAQEGRGGSGTGRGGGEPSEDGATSGRSAAPKRVRREGPGRRSRQMVPAQKSREEGDLLRKAGRKEDVRQRLGNPEAGGILKGYGAPRRLRKSSTRSLRVSATRAVPGAVVLAK